MSAVLIETAWAPITFCAGFLELPLDEVVRGATEWYREMKLPRGLETAQEGPLAEALSRLEPLSAPDFRRVWIATSSSRWQTAYFDGFINGTDAAPPIGYLAQRLGCHGLVVGAQPDVPPVYGGTTIALYGPQMKEWSNLEWSVTVANDGGRWTFSRNGTPQPFEETEQYGKRRVADRFTPAMLRRYCAALGVPLDPGAFGRWVLDVPTWRGTIQRRESVAAARMRLGLATSTSAV